MLKVAPPRLGFFIGQPQRAQNRGEITPGTDLFLVRHDLSDGSAILEQHKADALVAGTIDAIGKISGGFRNRESYRFHKIRLSDKLVRKNSDVPFCTAVQKNCSQLPGRSLRYPQAPHRPKAGQTMTLNEKALFCSGLATGL